MPTLSIDDEALRVGINYHMCRLKNKPFDPNPEAIAAGMIVEPRELFFDVSTVEKAAVSKKLVQYIRAKHQPNNMIIYMFFRWRHKLLFPTLSSLPVLMVYYVQGSSTTIVVPKIARSIVSFLGFEITTSLDINLLYYVFMGMVIVFCTNSINIYAGINGLEVGQSLVIASSITLYNVIQLYRLQDPIECWYNWLSIYFLLPFITTSLILYNFNKYPARVFVGDTYCYWAGMTLAVVAILGHFSKTAMLFFIPQAFNFIYLTPQLFHLVPCPRHRLPKFDSKTDTVGMSFAEFKKSELNRFGRWVVTILSTIGLLFKEDFNNDGEK
ncbi:unnamed protein product, partial [Mesorhabditis belari]|uniref:UDP-N-acetylglucosamine--dolichyl-phosphate N-acetylglucosaminephosphotransferase n=1 Tax=Mesorhabditis belari TaxID=2138241 RepID=A0AAF3F8V4_9BILA